MIRRLFVLMASLIFLAACALPINPAETEFRCQPSRIQKSENDFLEIRGNMKSDGELWALPFFEAAHVNEDEKIVWRITGESDEFHAQAQNEEGKILTPIWTE